MKIGLAAIVACNCLASPAWAQTPRANGPFSGLFGAGSSPSHALDFHGYLFGAYQEVLLSPEELEVAELDPRFQRSRSFAGATGVLNYRYDRRGNHSFFNVTADGAVADYSIRPDEPQYTASASASAGLFGRITPKIQYATSVSTSYSPYYGYTPFSPGTFGSGDPALVGPQFAGPTTRRSTVPVTATAYVTDQLSRRSTLSATLGYQKLFVLDDLSNSFEGWNGDIRYRHQLTRRLGVYGGYRYAEYRYSGSDNVGRNQGADFGFDYGDALTLPLGRRTTATLFGAVTGAGGTDPGAPVSSTSTHYALTGSANINHIIGRTWSAAGAYDRSLRFSALFDQPFLTDTVNGSISGLLAPRLNFGSSAGWLRGQVGFGADANHVSSSFASSMLTFALFRPLGLYAQYVYYRYEVPRGRFTRFNLPTHTARQVASVGLTVWVPIFHHNARSALDSR